MANSYAGEYMWERKNTEKNKGRVPSQMWMKQDEQYVDKLISLMEEYRLKNMSYLNYDNQLGISLS